MTKAQSLKNVPPNSQVIIEDTDDSIMAVQIYGHPCIKLSDFDKYRDKWTLDERSYLICPDHTYDKLIETALYRNNFKSTDK